MLRNVLKVLLIYFLCLISVRNIPLFAEENKVIDIPLVYPQKYNSPMADKPKIEKPPIITETVILTIALMPLQKDIQDKRYLVEYFLDDNLIHKTIGNSSKEKLTFDYELDTTRYRNGTHKITVNFWDKNGPAAIGFRKVIIKNAQNNEN